MRIRLLRITAAFSLVLCAAALVMWVVSMWRIDGVRYNSANHTWQCSSGLGGVTASRYVSGFSELDNYGAWYTFSVTGDDLAALVGVLDPPPGFARLGFAWHHETFPVGGGTAATQWFVRVPYWFIVLLTGIPPGLWLRATRARRRRRALKRCMTCGYDIRATPGRCPECGTAAI